MSSKVYMNGKVREVKNLGWLLHHWREVTSFTVIPDKDSSAHVTAFLENGRYETPFASVLVLRKFLDRPVFRGLLTNWNGEEIVIGSDIWRNFP